MTFSVVWQEKALDELTAIWTDADSDLRQMITQAAHNLDEELQTDPFAIGESREGNDRISFIYPLGFFFEVSPNERLVTINHVWNIHKKK